MRHHGRRGGARGFTLVELLVVIGIISVLASIAFPLLGGIHEKGLRAKATSELRRLRLAIAAYRSEHGFYPKRPVRTASPLTTNDAAYLYEALRGVKVPSAQFLSWPAESIGYVAHPLPSLGDSGAGPFAAPLETRHFDSLHDAAFLATRTPGPGVTQALALLDPWGNPYFYREWCSLPEATVNGLVRTGLTCSRGDLPALAGVTDRPHEPRGFELWSFGPDGFNGWGSVLSDDVCSWRDQ